MSEADVAVSVFLDGEAARRAADGLTGATVDRIEERLRVPDARFLLVDLDEVTVGLGHWGPAWTSPEDHAPLPGVGHISAVFVRPAAWGSGVGRWIVRELLDDQRRSCLTRSQLFTHETNVRAQGLYMSEGFSATGLRSTNAEGLPILQFARSL